MSRPQYRLVTTGDARPGDELLAEVAERTGIAEIGGRSTWWRRLITRLLGTTPR